MFGTGLGHFIPLVAYLGFWVMSLMALTGRPLYGLYYMIPFIPYRTMRDHLDQYPLGTNLLTILVLAVIVGALFKGKRLPKSKLYVIWIVFAIYLYFSMWLGTIMGNAPAPIWLSDGNFVAWKDYLIIPLIFVAASLVIEDRKTVRTVILVTAVALFLIDRTCILESLSRSWGAFDESKRSPGPLVYGSNQTAAFLAQFAMFFWGLAVVLKRKKVKIILYGLTAMTIFAAMYTFSRGGYLAILLAVVVLAFLKDRKLLILVAVFLATWQTVVPTAVRERVTMTQNVNGQLEDSARERVELWQEAEDAFVRSPIVGAGFATFQYGEHVDNLTDTHNWYIKVLVETGVIGFLVVLVMLQQVIAVSFRLFRRASDPLYQGLGLGLLLAICACLAANCFGDRWTYVEITGILWILVAAALRALALTQAPAVAESSTAAVHGTVNPYLAYR
jgi:putative inorganic carbon (hco3(-)) transporter